MARPPSLRVLRRPSVLVIAVSLLFSLAAFGVSRRAIGDEERQLLELQAGNAATALNAMIGQIRSSLASLGAAAAATGGDPAALRPLTGARDSSVPFSYVAVLHRGSRSPLAASGVPRADLAALPSTHAANLVRAEEGGGFVVVGFAGTGKSRVAAFALGPPDVPAGYVVYAEIPLPKGIVVQSPFPGLDYALYTGEHERAADLVMASTTSLPLDGKRTTVLLELGSQGRIGGGVAGDKAMFVIASHRSPLGALTTMLPWILVAMGVVSGAAIVTVIEVLARRRDEAVRLAADLAGKNAALDEALAERERAHAARERLEAELRQAQRMEAIGQLAGGIAHDFNNLLAVIISYTDFVADALPRGHEVQDDLAEVRNAARRAASLTHQLLVFSRRDHSEPRVLDVNACIADLARLLERAIGEQYELRLLLGPDLPPVLADPGEVEQVVMNLAVNARDAMEGGGVVRVATSLVTVDDVATGHGLAPGRYVRLSVSDDGTGMTPDVAARAFDPFFTTKRAGSGTGLGLATVYGVATRRGGTVVLRTEAGLGTTVHVFLPVTHRTPEAEPIPPDPTAASGERILLVEDEPSVRRAARRILEAAGYEVVEAADGVSALALGDDVDLLLTDVVMPGGMTGGDLADELRHRRPDLRVLFMSGYSADALGERAEHAQLVEKPFTDASLLDNVRRVLA